MIRFALAPLLMRFVALTSDIGQVLSVSYVTANITEYRIFMVVPGQRIVDIFYNDLHNIHVLVRRYILCHKISM